MTEYPPASNTDGGWSGYQPAGYQPPGYQPPGYQPAGYQPYGPPQYGQSPYGQPPYGQPQYGQPQYGQPQSGQAPPGWYPYPPDYGTGYGPPERRLDGWSVTGLVCGILPTVVLGLAFSVVGLIRTGNPLRRGRGFAVAGLVLSLAWLAGFGALGALTDDRQPQAAPAIAGLDTNPVDLQVGDCFQQVPLTGQITVHTVPKVPCDQSHNAMIVATVQPAYSTYPGLSTLLDQAVALCHPKDVSYLGRPLGRLRSAAFAPPESLWNSGLKQASCVLYDPDRNFTGDIREDR